MRDGKKTIVCIEDEPEMIDLIRLMLGRAGFTVYGGLGGAEGLRVVRATEPDLVLLDLMMPDVSGWDVYHTLKADSKLSGIPVIIITARALPLDRMFGLHIAKVQEYITKPFSSEELIDSVKQAMEEQPVSVA